jgi:hypothetical protein
VTEERVSIFWQVNRDPVENVSASIVGKFLQPKIYLAKEFNQASNK